MKAVFWFSLFATLLLAHPMNAEEGVNMTGLQLKAASVALADFTSLTQPKARLSDYRVFIEESVDAIEIIFVPNQPPDEPEIRGGRTKYGREVRYKVSRERFEIIDKSYAR